MPNLHPAEHSHGIDLESALDFLNTLHPGHGRTDEQHQRDEHLALPADAAMWFLEQGLIHPEAGVRINDIELARIRRVRAALREVVDAVVEERPVEPDAVHLVNAVLEQRRPTRLELDGTALRIGHRHAETPVDDALALIAEAIVEELATGRPERLRVCANDRCRWAFFDSSPTGRRRWCDMRSCGNQAKAARHRARMRGEAGEDHDHDAEHEHTARPN
jgi:predicted RNA-binding Zn ribbon-like protein